MGSRARGMRGPRWRSAHGHRDALDEVVAEALVVPGLLQRLDVAGGVGGADGQFMFAGVGVPVIGPATPGVASDGWGQGRVVPLSVYTDLDPRDRAGSRPGPARPERVTRPGSMNRRRVKKSGIPGGIISPRTRIRVTGVPGSPGWR